MRATGCILVCLLAVLCAWAAPNTGGQLAGQMTDTVALAPGEPIKSEEVRDFVAKGPRASGKRTVLLLEIRMDNPLPGGSNYGMSLTLNGRDLGTARDWMNGRLLGKAPVAHMKSYVGAQGPWYRGGWWLLTYAPDFTGQQTEEGDDCLFLWDVTDLLGPDGAARVQITSQTKRLEEQVKHPVPLVIGRFQLGLLDAKLLERALGTPRPVPPPVKGTTLQGKGFTASLAAGGGLVVQVGKEPFLLRSQFSYPREPEGGWNCLEPTPQSVGGLSRARPAGEPSWQPQVTRTAGGALQVEAHGKRYALKREISLAGHRLLVRDTFTNLTDEIIGLRLDNQIDSTGRKIADVTLAGNNNPNLPVNVNPGDHPTVFVKQGRGGLGLLAEDDVFRVQSRLEYSYPLGSLGDWHFGLAPRASYTLQWALYPTASGDAWDFINQVRRDWQVNFTVPAGSLWCDCSSLMRMSDEDLKRYIENTGAYWIMATPWLDTWPLPTRPTHEQILATEKEALAKLRRVCPQAKLLMGTHPTMNFCPPGKYFDSEEYRDSWILDESGKHFWHKWYTDYFCTGLAKEQGFLNFCNFMTVGNSYYGKMVREADFAQVDCGVDGIYCDEFNHYNNLSPNTYGRWDGHWVEVDPKTFAAKTDNPMAQLALLTDEAQEQYARRVLARGIFLANSQPVTRRLQNLHFTRFVETPVPEAARRGTLFSPLAYGNPPFPKDEAGLFQYLRDRVNNCAITHIGGMPPVTRPVASARMFPFTPVDIRPGILRGQERIITTVSGQYGWPGKYQARRFVYDAAGVLEEAQPAAKTYTGPFAVKVPEQGMVIVEKCGK